MAILPGDRAPSFSLFSSDREEVTLEQFRGNKNVLLAFIPLVFTSTCEQEMKHLRKYTRKYEKRNAEILVVSVDSPYALARYKKSLRLKFLLLSDFNREASRAYDCLYEEFMLGMREVSKRSAFIIDKSGIIQYNEVLENADELPDFPRIEEVLKELSG